MRTRLLVFVGLLVGCHHELAKPWCVEDPSNPACFEADAEPGDAGSEAASAVGGDAGDADATSTCEAGTLTCNGATLARCEADGGTSVVATCPSAATCDASLGRCTACVPGTVSCDGAKLVKCDALGAANEDVETCATPALCAASGSGPCKAPTCAVGERRCGGTLLERCNSDRTAFESEATCAIACGIGACVTVKQLSVSNTHGCALLSNGSLRCWGRNADGELGLGSAGAPVPKPTVVSSVTNAIGVAAGGGFTCVALSDGTVKCWGANGSGQLGDGTTTPKLTPTTAVGLASVVEIAAGGGHTCARRSDGTVRCWGEGFVGQLGIGTKPVYENSPKIVPGLAGVTQIAAGGADTCALLADKTVRCWGSTMTSPSPVALSGLAGATRLSIGATHGCAVIADGTARCWGSDDYGELGTGSIGDGITTTPVLVVGLTGVLDIQAGGRFTCVRQAASVRCWGANSVGQLGDGTIYQRTTPAPVSAVASVDLLAASEVHVVAAKGAALWAWGDDTTGQLASGGTGGYVKIPTSVTW